MILRLYNFDNCFDTDMQDHVICIECMHRPTYRNILANVKGIDCQQQEIAVLKNDKVLDLGKSCFVISDYYDFAITSKTIQTKLYNKIIADNMADIDVATKFQQNFVDIISNIENLINDVDLNLHMVSNLDIKDFFKLVGLDIADSSNPLERVLDFIALNNYLKLYDVIVLVNPKSFFNNQEIVEIYRYALYNESNLISLECAHATKTLDCEKRISIDEDLFDIYL